MRRVVWTDQARTNLLDIIAFIAAENPIAAERVIDRIERTAVRLGEMPTGRKGRVGSTYEKIVTGLPYILVYSLTPQDAKIGTVTIVRIIHGARDWPEGQWPE